jgi:predicted nucleic acid-binding Zn ribbon protein
MPIYVYETLSEPVERFEIKQSMKDEPLKSHPETGVPIRRVISGGYGIMQKGGTSFTPAPRSGGGGCGPSCGCHH